MPTFSTIRHGQTAECTRHSTGSPSAGMFVPGYSAILFAVPEFKIQAPDELVDDDHPPRFKPHYTGDFIRFRASQGARHEDKLQAFCGV
ncbi:hypothetical protein BS78_01G132000 [Paspalum vaginatum]|nr:hypothetical protein BS78_01G132000 [Paspalum vaginatum]